MGKDEEKKTSIREKLAKRKNSQTSKNIVTEPSSGKSENASVTGRDKEQNLSTDSKIKKIAEDKKRDEQYKKLLMSNNELTERLQRLMAEFDNFRKRTTKERLSVYASAVSEVVEKLLPILDNLERALCSATDDDKKSSYYRGIEMVLKQFLSMITELGVEVIDVNPGDDFNHEIHDAVAHVEDESFGENKVMDVLEKGYKYKDKVIRYCKVRVAN